MAKYIDKSALVAEIERLYDEKGAFYAADVLYNLEEWLDTLEVKEVNFEKEFNKCCENYIFDDECEVYTARHFFELGLKVK